MVMMMVVERENLEKEGNNFKRKREREREHSFTRNENGYKIFESTSSKT